MALAVGIGAIWMEYECSHDRWPTSGGPSSLDKQIPLFVKKIIYLELEQGHSDV